MQTAHSSRRSKCQAQVLCSAETMAQAEARVQQISAREYALTRQILATNRSALDAVAAALLERETLSGEEVALLCAGSPAPAKTLAAANVTTDAMASGARSGEQKASPAVESLPSLPQLAGC